MLDQNQINEFRNSGVLLLKGYFLEWIEGLRKGVEFNLKHPGEFSRIYTGEDESGYFLEITATGTGFRNTVISFMNPPVLRLLQN